MPMQEIFQRIRVGSNRFHVLKTYDTSLAKEVFSEMDRPALGHLANSLSLEEQYDPEDIPESPSEYADFLWDEMLESAREDGQVRSFFVVTRISSRERLHLYVSGDWPSAEEYLQRVVPGGWLAASV